MRENGIVGKHRRKFKSTTDSSHDLAVAPNLLKQQFDVPRPNVAWSSDITQLATPEGWLYLAVVLDLFARVVVGWALRNDITRHLVLEAVGMAIALGDLVRGSSFTPTVAASTRPTTPRSCCWPTVSGRA
jgi:putative transposase